MVNKYEDYWSNNFTKSHSISVLLGRPGAYKRSKHRPSAKLITSRSKFILGKHKWSRLPDSPTKPAHASVVRSLLDIFSDLNNSRQTKHPKKPSLAKHNPGPSANTELLRQRPKHPRMPRWRPHDDLRVHLTKRNHRRVMQSLPSRFVLRKRNAWRDYHPLLRQNHLFQLRT